MDTVRAEDLTLGNTENSLKTKINEFNSAFKMGIDLGKSVGFAIVKDNKVIFAHTLVDMSISNLKNRREHRRNRRSRRAREKRLAKLRSWVLRQKVDGKQLPDPYKIRNKIFENKHNLISTVINGTNTTPEAFVRSLSLIFSKRGQEIENISLEISEYTNKHLLKEVQDLLKRSVVGEEEIEVFKDELTKRYEESDEEKKKQYANIISEFEDIDKSKFKKFINRKEHKKQIEDVVSTFYRVNKINNINKGRWIKELKGLLDKPVRKVRFKNKIVIGCNICGSITPKKNKNEVRRFEYDLAVLNFLTAGRIKEEEKEEAKSYFTKIFNSTEKIRDEIKSIENLKENKEQCPVSDGELKEEQKSELEKQKKERTRQKTSITKKFKTYYSKNKLLNKKQSYVEKQINDLLYTKIRGRSRYCTKHLKSMSQGVDLEKDIHGIRRKRYDRNFIQQNHDKRVINFIEKSLFDNNDSEISKLIKLKGIKYISIEAPEPKTKRTKKGQTSKKDERKIKEKIFDKLNSTCIYTGEELNKDNLNLYELDHIFPKSRGGPNIRDNYVITTKNTNKEKGNRTPYQWIEKGKFEEFRDRVDKFFELGYINLRKKEILLYEGNEYPDNPTELARTGARVSSFIYELSDMLEKHGLDRPQTLFEKGKPIVQVVRGYDTAKLRKQWNAIKPGEIPIKDELNAFNHAEDAAIIASIPPATWRERIFRYDGKFENSEKMRPDFAPLILAPCWNTYELNRNKSIVSIISKTRYSWKKHFIDDTFYIFPNEKSRFDDIYTLNKSIPKPLNQQRLDKEHLYYHKKIDQSSNYLIRAQRGGTTVMLKPLNKPERYIQIKPIRSGVLLIKEKDKIKKFVRPIYPLIKLYESNKIDLSKLSDAEIAESLKNRYYKKYIDGFLIKQHDIFYLEKTKKHESGYFIVTKIGKKNVISIKPEKKIKTYEKSKVKNYNTNTNEIENKKKDSFSLSTDDINYIYTKFESQRAK